MSRRSLQVSEAGHEFCKKVELVVELFRLDLCLDEIREMMDDADYIVAGIMGMSEMDFLRRLNPHTGVSFHHGRHFIIDEPVEQAWLRPWSLARYHIDNLDERLAKIRVNYDATHFIDDRGYGLVSFQSAYLGANRRNTPDNGYQKSTALIEEFTGVEIDWRDLVDTTHAVLVELIDGSWQYTIELINK